MPKIAGAWVEVRPESSGFRLQVRRDIAQALASVSAAIPLKVEGRGLREEVRRAAATAAAGASASVDVKAEAKGLRSEVARAAAVAGAGQNVKVGVSVDDRKLKSLLSTVAGGAAGAGGALQALVIPPAFLQGISAATSGLVAMAGAAVAVVAPLSQLAGLIPALAVGGIAVAAGFGVVKGALSGVGDALKAYSAEQKEAATAAVGTGRSATAAARAQEAAAEAVENATDRLAQAQENQTRSAERSAESIADAQRSVADAQDAQVQTAERSAESIARAQDRVIDAHGRVEDSERELVVLREETAERAAEAQERYAERVAQSNEDILRAEQDLADRRIELAEDVADAQARLDEDRLDGQERIAAAEQRVRDVQQRSAARDRERRQRDQDRQRLDAAKTPEERQRIQSQIDARKAREEEADDRQRAASDLKDAQDDLARARKDAADREKKDREALADAQKAQAEGIEDAEQKVTDARKAGLEVQKEGQRLARQQVEDERRIAEAVGDVEDARKAEAEAQREVGRAHLDASRDAVRAERAVADAVADLARTRRDADRSAQDASKAVLDAQRDLERAMRRVGEVAEEVGTSGAASVDKFAVAMDGLSPAAQSFVRALIGVKDTLKGLRDTAAAGLFPGFEQGLVGVKPLLDSLHPSISLVAGTIGNLTAELGKLLGGPESLKAFAELGASSAGILDRLGRAALVLVPPIGQLLVAAIPLATTLADMAESGAKVFASWVDGKSKTGELAAMFRNTESTLRTLMSITGNVGGALRGIFTAALPTGLEYLGMLDRATGKLRDLVRSDAGQSGLRKFFEDSKPLVQELTGLFGDLVKGLGGIGASLAPQLTPIVAQIRNDLLPVLLSMVDTIDGEFLSTLVSAATSIAGLIAAFAQPTGALKIILEDIGKFADFVTFLLTDLGPASVLIQNMGTALAFVGTAIAGIKIARLISDFKGLGAVKTEIAGVEAAAGAAATKVGGIGTAARVLGLAGIFLAVKGTIDDLAPAIDKTTQKLLAMPASVKDFDKEVAKLANPSIWERVALDIKGVFSKGGLFNEVERQAKLSTDAAGKEFKKLAQESPQFAFNLIEAMRQAGRPTADFERIIRDLGLGQQFMASQTAIATQKIRDQIQAEKDAKQASQDHRLAQVNLLDSIDRLDASVAKNGRTFEENTAAGRENIRAREDVVTQVERSIEVLIKDSEQNGIDAGEVSQLRNRLDELKNKYPELSGEIDRFKTDFNRSLQGIEDRTVKLVLEHNTVVLEQEAGGARTAAGVGLESGGHVTGNLPRRGPTDTIPAWLAPREFVVNARATDAVGPETLAYINKTGRLPGFAKGGYVNPHAAAPGFAAGGLIDFKMLLPHIGPIIDAGHAFIDGQTAALSEEARASLQSEVDARGAASSPAGGGTIGAGSVGSGWEEITRYLDSVGQDYTVTSTVRPGAITASGNLSNHALGKAVDMVGDMSSIFDVLLNIGSSLSELFYDPKGYCVPLDSLCLTRSGWKHWDEVVAGEDETIGYNPATGRNEWARITEVVTFADEPVVELSRRGWKARTTPNHRWVAERRASVGGVRTQVSEFVTSAEITSEHKLILSAPADTDDCSKVSSDEAAIIGWLLTDGHVTYGWPDKRGVSASIYQAKPDQVIELRRLLATAPHTEHVGRPAKAHHLDPHVFTLQAGYARDLIERSGIDEVGVEGFVLSLGTEARRAFLDAAWRGDGSMLNRGHDRWAMKTFAQNDGQVLDGVLLAAYLEGYRPTRNRVKPSGYMRHPHTVSAFARPTITGQGITTTEMGREPVWCVVTSLGSWTMQQDGQISLTGNSIKNGERVDWTVGGHDDHVHAATFDRGGVLEPGWNRVRNATGARETLAPVVAGTELRDILLAIRSMAALIERTAAHTHPVNIDGRPAGKLLAPHVAEANHGTRESHRRS